MDMHEIVVEASLDHTIRSSHTLPVSRSGLTKGGRLR